MTEFHQKYPRIIGKKLFNKEGEEVYIYEYKGGLVKCFFGKDAKPKKIKLSEFEAVLGEYSHSGESGKKTISTEKEKKEALHEKIDERKEVKPAQESQELLDELDNFKTFAEEFLSEFLNNFKEKDWDGFSRKNKRDMQRIMTEVELVKAIRKHSEFIKKEDAEKVAKEIAEKII